MGVASQWRGVRVSHSIITQEYADGARYPPRLNLMKASVFLASKTVSGHCRHTIKLGASQNWTIFRGHFYAFRDFSLGQGTDVVDIGVDTI